MKGPGKGQYQDDLDMINRLKVLHKLSIKPYTYEILRNETKIQRNRLRTILNYFVDKKIVIPYKYTKFNKIFDKNNNNIIKNGLYHILDIDNEESLKYLADIIWDLRIKYLFDNDKDFGDYYRETNKERSLHEKGYKYSTIYKKNNKYIQSLNVVKNTDPLFFPGLYLKDFNYNIKVDEIAKKWPHLLNTYAKYMFAIDKELSNKDLDFSLLKHMEEIKNLLIYQTNNRLSKYDILIFYSWTCPSRYAYVEYWNAIKNHSI